MKRSVIVLLFVLLSGTMLVRGQFIDSYGLKTGLCIANQSIRFTPIDTELPTDVLIGPTALVFAEIFKGKHLSFQMDLGVMFKGCKTTAQSVTVDHTNNDRIVVNEGPLVTSAFQYITVSAMGRFERQYGAFDIYALLGPRLDYLVNYASDSPYPLDTQHAMLIGLTGGFGTGYSLENFRVFGEFQYLPDLRPVYNITPLLINNNAICLCIGIGF